MKKNKILNSLTALVLVLCAGGCDSSSDDTQGIVNNYSLSFDFSVSGSRTQVPNYGSLYLVGSYDEWSSFRKLELNNNAYVTTFDSINSGTYEYRILIWYNDSEVSFLNSIDVINSDSFMVRSANGDNYVESVSYSLTTAFNDILPTKIDNIDTVKSFLTNLTVDELSSWEAFEYEQIDATSESIKTESAYLTTVGELYGLEESAESSGNSSTYYSTYYQAGTKYIDNNGILSQTEENIPSYLEKLDEYSAFAVSEVDTLLSLDSNDFNTMASNGNTLTLWIMSSNSATRYDFTREAAGRLLEEVTISEKTVDGYITTSSNTKYFASIGVSDVRSALSSFDPSRWDGVSNPGELLLQIQNGYNYSLSFELEKYEASLPVSYGDWLDGKYDKDEINDSMVMNEYDRVDGYYTDDILLVINYISDSPNDLILFYNYDGNHFYEYTYDLNTANTEWAYKRTYDGRWQNYYYTLATTSYYGIQNKFVSSGYGTLDGEYFDAYYFTDYDSDFYYFLCGGSDLLFGDDAYTYAYSYFTSYLTFFFPGSQRMITNYYFTGWGYHGNELVGGVLTEDTPLYFNDWEVYITVSDVGNTDISRVLSLLIN